MNTLKLFTTRDCLIKQFTKDAECCEQGKVDWDTHMIAFDNGNTITYQVMDKTVHGSTSHFFVIDEWSTYNREGLNNDVQV